MHMSQSITPRKRVPWLLWFLTVAIFLVGIGMVWYGWHSEKGLAWIFIGGLVVLVLIVVATSTRIALWLAHRVERQILRKPSLVSRQLVHTGLQQGEKLAQLGSRTLGKNVVGVKQTLSQTVNNFVPDRRRRTGTVTWISLPPGRRNAFCPGCGHGLRDGAKFCDHCGKPIIHV